MQVLLKYQSPHKETVAATDSEDEFPAGAASSDVDAGSNIPVHQVTSLHRPDVPDVPVVPAVPAVAAVAAVAAVPAAVDFAVPAAVPVDAVDFAVDDGGC